MSVYTINERLPAVEGGRQVPSSEVRAGAKQRIAAGGVIQTKTPVCQNGGGAIRAEAWWREKENNDPVFCCLTSCSKTLGGLF